jgi:hypothetical protein
MGAVHGHTDGSALEVAAVRSLATGDVDEWVVAPDGVDLAFNRPGGEADDLDLRAEPLRRCTKREGAKRP